MALNFDNEIPEWKNEGVEPSTDLKEKGFVGGYKPPAAVFNWFWSKVQKCITELQSKVSSIDSYKANVEHTHDVDEIMGTLPLIKGGTGASTAAAARTALGLGTAATIAYTASVTEGSTSLVTSGAVYNAISSLIGCYKAISDGTNFTVNADRNLSAGDLFFVKFSANTDLNANGILNIVYNNITVGGLMCGFDNEGLHKIKADTLYLALYDSKGNVLLQSIIADSILDGASANAVANNVITTRLQNIETRLAALEGNSN